MQILSTLTTKAKEALQEPAIVDLVDKASQKAVYTTSGITIVSGLTLTELGVVVGIIGTVITVSFNIWFKMKYQRKVEEI